MQRACPMPEAPLSRGVTLGVAALAFLGACNTWGQALAESENPRVTQARALEYGEGVAKDQLRAARLYCEAARDGDAEAAYSLGWMDANGRGIARDDMVASALFALAAEAGHADARRALAFVGADKAPLPGCMRRIDAVTGIPESAEFAITVDDPFDDLPLWTRKIAVVVRELASRYEVNPRLALAVIAVESNFDALARSDKNAQGLMQLIPETAARFNVKDTYDIKDNVRGGLSYLRWLLAYYRGQVPLAAAAYNAGEKAVDRYRGIPPYAETRDYVQRIQRLYPQDRHPYDARIADPSPVVAADHARAR
ncbi:MAG: transglycosylase SLT domain-containing protein [Burkholderiales bacterium]|nr:transglycosylase SLT domain-containing protein [Burkholderiales bacterium]